MANRPGPPPMAPELKVLRGRVDPRKSPAVDHPGTVPDAPPELADRGREAWSRYWTAGRTWLTLGDFELIRRLCGLIDRAAAIEAKVDAEGFLVVNRRTGRSHLHASYNVVLGINRHILDLERVAGLPSTERGRVAQRPDEDDAMARWMAQ